MERITFGDRLEYAAFRLTGAILGALPIETASNASGWLWRIVAPRLSRHRRALAHLKAAFPEKTEAERDAIARQMWEGLGRVFAESFHLAELRDGSRVTFPDQAAAQAAIEPGQGWILCSAHLGNWEVVIFGALRIGLSPTGVYQRIKNPLVDAAVRAMRAPFYPSGIFQKNAATGTRLLRHARAGGTSAFLADLRENTGKPVPFFGRPAPSTPFPALLARSLGRPLFVGLAIREPGVRFRIELEQIDVARTDNRENDVVETTARIQATFEKWIRRYPEQWMWAHRRWG